MLSDPTGNRRLLPIEITSIDFNVIDSVDRKKMIAEASLLLDNGYDIELSSNDKAYLGSNENFKFEVIKSETETMQQLFLPSKKGEVNTDAFTMTELIKIVERHSGDKVYRRGFPLLLEKSNYGKALHTYVNNVQGRYYFLQKLKEHYIYA